MIRVVSLLVLSRMCVAYLRLVPGGIDFSLLATMADELEDELDLNFPFAEETLAAIHDVQNSVEEIQHREPLMDSPPDLVPLQQAAHHVTEAVEAIERARPAAVPPNLREIAESISATLRRNQQAHMQRQAVRDQESLLRVMYGVRASQSASPASSFGYTPSPVHQHDAPFVLLSHNDIEEVISELQRCAMHRFVFRGVATIDNTLTFRTIAVAYASVRSPDGPLAKSWTSDNHRQLHQLGHAYKTYHDAIPKRSDTQSLPDFRHLLQHVTTRKVTNQIALLTEMALMANAASVSDSPLHAIPSFHFVAYF